MQLCLPRVSSAALLEQEEQEEADEPQDTLEGHSRVAMENDPVVDDVPIKHGDFPLLC